MTKDTLCGESRVRASGWLSAVGLWGMMFVPGLVHAAIQPPGDFAGVPWDATPGEATRALVTQAGAKAGESEGDELRFTGGKFANKPVLDWTLDFENGRFAAGCVNLVAEGMPLFDQVSAYFEGRYGEATESAESEREWKLPPDPKTGEMFLIRCRFQQTANGADPAYEESVRIEFVDVPVSAPENQAAEFMVHVGSWEWGGEELCEFGEDGTVMLGEQEGSWRWTDRTSGLLEIAWSEGPAEKYIYSDEEESIEPAVADAEKFVALRAEDGDYFGSTNQIATDRPQKKKADDLPKTTLY